MLTKTRWIVCPALLAMAAFVSGCSDGGGDSTSGSDTDGTTVAHADDHDDHEVHDDHKDGEGGHAHGEWWCSEHGVPEEECTRCDSSLIAGFKEKGDWCEKHDVPESQCFQCDPKRAEPFIARYEAKYGKKPTALTE